MNIDIITLTFDYDLVPYEIPLFRGAIIHSLEHKSLLFHNHEGEGFRYAYPLIQYKRLEGKASILCINKGVEYVEDLLALPSFSLKLKNRIIETHIINAAPQTFDVFTSDNMYIYHIGSWCPFNEDNWRQYNKLQGLVERIIFLEKILTGNIISFAKGIGWHIEEEVKCNIKSIDREFPHTIKGVNMTCLDVDFQCNVSLPNYIGLGKHVSISYGVLRRIDNQQQHNSIH